MGTRPTFGFVVEYVADVEASKNFYVDVLGLQVERYHPTFVQFDRFGIASDEPMDGGAGPELYWLVDDAEAAFRDMAAKAEITLPLTMKAFGKVFGVTDPDGRPRYLLELARERPSRPVE